MSDPREPLTPSSAAFQRRIERVRQLTDGQRVPVDNSSEATYCIDADGRQWVRKRSEVTGFNEIIAESIGWLLSDALHLPVPRGAVAEVGQDPSWLSERVPSVTHWGEGHGHFVINGDGLGGVLALDAILMNQDRHAGNILLQPQGDEFHLRAWGIDFGDAMVGWPSDYAALGDKALPLVKNVARGIPPELVTAGAMAAAMELAAFPGIMIGEFVSEACELAREPVARPLAKAVTDRCSNAISLVERYLLELKALGAKQS